MDVLAMFRLIRPAAPARYVDRGCVRCPVRGRDVELDLCAGCQHMTELGLQAEPPFVRCRPEPMPPAFMRIWG